MINAKHSDYEKLFCPCGMAVIGAGAEAKAKFGSMFLKANIDSGFAGKLYPVHPAGGETRGLKVYKSVSEIAGPVDLACVAVPAKHVIAALDDCVAKGVSWAQILSAGFSESDDDGRALENELKKYPERGLRIVGPNCFGVHCPTCGLTILPGGGFSRKPGTVAFIGQSGGLAVDLGYASPGLGFGWRRMVSFGNASDLDSIELIRYFGDDVETEIITAYIEGVADGRAFFESVKYAASKKPVIVWKGGLTKGGARAVMSHTGSIGGEAALWAAAMKQANAVMVNGQEEMLDTAHAFSYLGDFTGQGLAIIGGGGALGVAAGDAADRDGLRLPVFSKTSREQMEKLLPPPGTSFNNPADVGNPMIPMSILEKIMSIAADENDVDCLILIQLLHHMTHIVKQQMDLPAETKLKSLAQHIQAAASCAKIRAEKGKPTVMVLPPISSEEEKLELEGVLREARRVAHEAGIPTFLTIDRAIKAIAKVSEYYRRKR